MTALDRLRLSWFLVRLDYHIADLPRRRRREIRRELGTDTRDAARDIGVPGAVADLGRPRVLAEDCIRAEGRPLPHYTRGAVWAAVSLAAYMYLVMSYSFGLADGAIAASTDLEGGLVGTEVAALAAEADSLIAVELSYSPWILLLPAAAFVLAGRLWRLLPPWRDRPGPRQP
ncbi:hypothetical protein [Allosalinactinospora lopnorensis]|uniref:hypothetical protein n=1 Tax=Allosalinactinospora lopnorensis TaxID=1352348 RepID=UPI000623C912|nr:hypothetical protein [Allosalinactinospora lopnorensis]